MIERNGEYEYKSRSTNRYIKSNGQVIEFKALQKEKWSWSIISIDGVLQDRDMKRWPFAEGPIINSKQDGKVVVDNPFLGKRLILNMSNALNHERTFEDN